MNDLTIRLQHARERLRRIVARQLRYPHDDRLRRLHVEASFRVTELAAYLEERMKRAARDRGSRGAAAAPPAVVGAAGWFGPEEEAVEDVEHLSRAD